MKCISIEDIVALKDEDKDFSSKEYLKVSLLNRPYIDS
jgi:hypothetical protein